MPLNQPVLFGTSLAMPSPWKTKAPRLVADLGFFCAPLSPAAKGIFQSRALLTSHPLLHHLLCCQEFCFGHPHLVLAGVLKVCNGCLPRQKCRHWLLRARIRCSKGNAHKRKVAFHQPACGFWPAPEVARTEMMRILSSIGL